ncbi:MAG TPA: cytochrome c oxidase accessory protein CcoG [Acetobacteraceae bacterium]|jgi:cytochrome c oxidase accessory protein FixG
MSRISKLDRQRQIDAEESGQHLYANRVRVYPKSVHGPVRTFKWAVLIACLSIYYLLPWLRWHRGVNQPDQALLLDIYHERFYFFDLKLWPQDMVYLAGLLIMSAIALFLVTSLIGRVWCGYTCPQTVWTDLFMWVERLLEGDRNERMKRDAAPLSFNTIWRKATKHAAWLGIAFWTGGAWIMYYVDAPTVTVEFWTGTASKEVYFFTGLFTATTYLLAGWAREQVCTYMCPWPRFQSAMLDEQSLSVTYQAWRGEPRTRGKRHPNDAAGDCVDCGACVTACPTGIDIRDGIQLECINCGLCIDACNHVMHRTGRPGWLITWDTLADQAAKARGEHTSFRFFRPRTIIYVSALVLGICVMGIALAMRPDLGLSVLHDRAPLFVRLANGDLRNGYDVKISNKANASVLYELSVQGLPGAVLTESDEELGPASQLGLTVGADTIGSFRVLVAGQPALLKDGTQSVDFVLSNTVTRERTVYHSLFMGPGEPVR